MLMRVRGKFVHVSSSFAQVVICLHVNVRNVCISMEEQVCVGREQPRSCVSLQMTAQNSPVCPPPILHPPILFAIPLIPLLVAALLRSRACLALVNAPGIRSAPLFSNNLRLHSTSRPCHPHRRRALADFSCN